MRYARVKEATGEVPFKPEVFPGDVTSRGTLCTQAVGADPGPVSPVLKATMLRAVS